MPAKSGRTVEPRRELLMTLLDQIGHEKQRISERLTRLDAERTKLGEQLNELEIAQRALKRFGGKATATKERRRGRAARSAPAADAARTARGSQPMQGVSLGDATLNAVRAHAKGASADELLHYLLRKFGLTARPNHLGSCSATAVPAGSNTAISAGTCRPCCRRALRSSRLRPADTRRALRRWRPLDERIRRSDPCP